MESEKFGNDDGLKEEEIKPAKDRNDIKAGKERKFKKKYNR